MNSIDLGHAQPLHRLSITCHNIPHFSGNSGKTAFWTGKRLKLLVAWGGIEPPTQGFSVLCSTN